MPTGKGGSFSTGGLEAERDLPCHTGGTENMGEKKKEYVPQPKMVTPVDNCQHPQLG